jgi:hypothetical protein
VDKLKEFKLTVVKLIVVKRYEDDRVVIKARTYSTYFAKR